MNVTIRLSISTIFNKLVLDFPDKGTKFFYKNNFRNLVLPEL